MYKAITLPLAKHIIEAAKWYNKRQNGLGRRFTLEVRKKIKFIKQYPVSIAIRYDGIRTAVLDVFPYMIHFTVDPQNKLVIIIAILSTHRDPETWKNVD